MVDDAAIRRLLDAGLIVRKFEDRSPYPGGYCVCKPANVVGNIRDDYECYFEDESILTNAPCADVFPMNDSWIFRVWESVPGLGPGDFVKEYASFDESVVALLEYYFGDPSWMDPPEYLRLKASHPFW